MNLRPDALLRLTAAIFQAAGCSPAEAQRIAEHLVEANLVGHDSHGVIRVFTYVQWLRSGKVLADLARQKGWRVEADLNNDIVGNTHGQGGEVVRDRVRVFSEGTKAVETPEQGAQRRYNGGELDSPSRNLGRFIDRIAELYVPGLDVEMIYRTDRFSRGGDHDFHDDDDGHGGDRH